jgi:hypothetical protein
MTRLSLEGCPCLDVVPLGPVKPPRPGSRPSPGLVWRGWEAKTSRGG